MVTRLRKGGLVYRALSCGLLDSPVGRRARPVDASGRCEHLTLGGLSKRGHQVSEKEKRTPGAEPETLKIDVPFEEAVRRALAKPIPPGGVPDKPMRPRRSKGMRNAPEGHG